MGCGTSSFNRSGEANVEPERDRGANDSPPGNVVAEPTTATASQTPVPSSLNNAPSHQLVSTHETQAEGGKENLRQKEPTTDKVGDQPNVSGLPSLSSINTSDVEVANKSKANARHSLSTSKTQTGVSVCGSERSIPGSYLTDEEEETVRDWLKKVVVENPEPIEEYSYPTDAAAAAASAAAAAAAAASTSAASTAGTAAATAAVVSSPSGPSPPPQLQQQQPQTAATAAAATPTPAPVAVATTT